MELEYASIGKQLDEKHKAIKSMDYYYDEFVGWAEEFKNASLECKKMIICHLIKKIEVGRNYEITIDFNMDYQQFLGKEQEQSQVTA